MIHIFKQSKFEGLEFCVRPPFCFLAIWDLNIKNPMHPATDSIHGQITILEPPHNKFPSLPLHCIGSHIQITYIQRRENVFGGHFVFWRFDTLILKIENVMRQIRIQHKKLILDPLHDKLYYKMPWGLLFCLFFKIGPWL